jgi:hypothetical protein
MGMSAEILALGPFNPSLVLHLPRPPELYSRVPVGALLLEPVVPQTPGSTTGRALAASVGASAWDFDTHALDPDRFDWPALQLALASYLPDPEVLIILARLRALITAGFRFWFQPNG